MPLGAHLDDFLEDGCAFGVVEQDISDPATECIPVIDQLRCRLLG